jgi:hypothetical protein
LVWGDSIQRGYPTQRHREPLIARSARRRISSVLLCLCGDHRFNSFPAEQPHAPGRPWLLCPVVVTGRDPVIQGGACRRWPTGLPGRARQRQEGKSAERAHEPGTAVHPANRAHGTRDQLPGIRDQIGAWHPAGLPFRRNEPMEGETSGRFLPVMPDAAQSGDPASIAPCARKHGCRVGASGAARDDGWGNRRNEPMHRRARGQRRRNVFFGGTSPCKEKVRCFSMC